MIEALILVGLLCAYAAGYVFGSLNARSGAILPAAAVTPSAKIDTFCLRYLDAQGSVIGEQTIPRTARRPEMRFRGAIYGAEQMVGDGVWVYRWRRDA